MKTKDELRKHIRSLKKQHSAEQLAEWSDAVLAKVEASDEFKRAATVMAFYSLPDEVQTPAFLKKWAASKRILLPVVVGDDILVKTYQGEESMCAGALCVMEPDGSEYFEDYDSIDLIIVPGVAFDRDGHRMGRGKGFYDRFLPQLPNAYKLGVCYPFQIIEEGVCCDAHDVPMDNVILI